MVAMLRVVVTLFCAALFTMAPGLAGAAGAADSGDGVELILFWGDGCPHCAAEKEWLASVVGGR